MINQGTLAGYGVLQSLVLTVFNKGKRLIPHYRQSIIKNAGGYEVEKVGDISYHYYPKNIKQPKEVLENVEFALKYEGLNLHTLKEVFKALEPKEIEGHILKKPKGKYERIIWYLYEGLTGKKLDIEDIPTTNYIDLLDSEEYYTSQPIKHKRYCINDNLLGTLEFAPMIRKSDKLKELDKKQLETKAQEVIQEFDPYVVHRAINYLYTKETIQSFEIEGEKPTRDKQIRFEGILKSLDKVVLDVNKESLLEVQNLIVEKFSKDESYRPKPIFVGIRRLGSTSMENAQVFYIAPSQKDLEELMNGLIEAYRRLANSNLPAVIKASLISFGFVYIHPFSDGNGRLSRLLLHKVLADEKFTPEGTIIPVSATMLKDRIAYDRALENFSKPLMNLLDYSFDSDGCINPLNNNADHYRYIDLTNQTEYLYECIETTIDNDFKDEMAFLANYDKAKTEIQNEIDLNDNDTDLFINLVAQNKGKLSERKKKLFKQLSPEEIQELEEIVRECFNV